MKQNMTYENITQNTNVKHAAFHGIKKTPEGILNRILTLLAFHKSYFSPGMSQRFLPADLNQTGRSLTFS